MKVVGFRNHFDATARPGERYVHLAELSCGHFQRVGHGHVPTDVTCAQGCDGKKPDAHLGAVEHEEDRV